MLDLLPEQSAAIETRLRELGWIECSEHLASLETAGEGNMNRTLRGHLGSETLGTRTLILKQSLPFVAKYPDIPAPAGRIEVEANFYATVARSAAAAQMPKLLGFDPTNRLLALEDLGEAADFTHLYARETSGLPDELPMLLAWLGHLHATPIERADAFDNRAMRELNHAHIFEIPFANDNGLDLDGITPGLGQAAQRLRHRSAVLARIATLGERYLATAGADDVLLHGDYYPGSWLRHPDGVKIIDPEFAFIGRPEFDLGVLRAHLVFADADTGEITAAMSGYPAQVDDTLVRHFAAVEVLRRLLGVAQLPLDATLERKVRWIDRAVTDLETS